MANVNESPEARARRMAADREYSRQYREKNREKVLEYNRAYYREHRESILGKRKTIEYRDMVNARRRQP